MSSGVDATSNDVVSTVAVTAASTAHPSHSLEPVIITHRVRWSILIRNLEGYTSELRCSLPIILLDHRLLAEAKRGTVLTRQLLFGDFDAPVTQDTDVELPSYREHVQDRVANMFFSDIAMSRLPNPLLPQMHQVPHHLMQEGPESGGTSGFATPYEGSPNVQLPQRPTVATETHLDWVNSELLLSLSSQTLTSLNMEDRPDAPLHQPSSGSIPTSVGESRTSSPEPHRRNSQSHSPSSGVDTYVHDASQASRAVPNIFQATMKPITSIKSHNWLTSLASSSHSSLHQYSQTSNAPSPPSLITQQTPPEHHRVTVAQPADGPGLLRWAYTEVPDYGVASLGFIGGVPPLSSSEGLPSYDQSGQEHNSPVPTPPTVAQNSPPCRRSP